VNKETLNNFFKFLKKSILVIFLLFLIIFIFTFFYIKTIDLTQFKSHIAKKISEASGAQVEINDLFVTMSLNQGFDIKVNGLDVNGNYSDEWAYHLYCQSIFLNIDIFNLVLQKSVNISHVSLKDPVIEFIHHKSVYNHQVRKTYPNNGEEPLNHTSSEIKKSKNIYDNFFFSSLKIENGLMSYIDNTREEQITIPMENINLIINNFSFEEQVPFKLSCSFLSDFDNIDINGFLHVDRIIPQLKLNDLMVESNFARLSIKKIKENIFLFNHLKGDIGGEFLFKMKQLTLTNEGLTSLKSYGNLKDGKFETTNVSFPIENVDIDFEMTQSKLDIKKIFMYFASGKIIGHAAIDDLFDKKRLSLDMSLEDLKVEEIIKNQGSDLIFKGALSGHIEALIQDMDSQDFLNTLKAESSFVITEGKVENINILRLLLEKISIIPNLSERVFEKLPEKYKEKLNKDYTQLKQVTIDTKFENGYLYINNADFDADILGLFLSGKIDLNRIAVLKGDCFLSRDLSSSFVSSVDEFMYLVNVDTEQIHIPLKEYRGDIVKYKPFPDIEKIGKSIIKNKGKDELKKVIFDALNIDFVPSEKKKDLPSSILVEKGDLDLEEKDELETPGPAEELINNFLDAIIR